jgi:hypothetical protein
LKPRRRFFIKNRTPQYMGIKTPLFACFEAKSGIFVRFYAAHTDCKTFDNSKTSIRRT